MEIRSLFYLFYIFNMNKSEGENVQFFPELLVVCVILTYIYSMLLDHKSYSWWRRRPS